VSGLEKAGLPAGALLNLATVAALIACSTSARRPGAAAGFYPPGRGTAGKRPILASRELPPENRFTRNFR